MKTTRILASLFAVALVSGLALAADDIKSGPQAKQKVPGPFHPLNINGAKAGEKNCLFCENGMKPVAMIFARETSPALTRLIKEVDAATAQSGGKMGSFVVFLSDGEGMEQKLKDLAKEADLKKCVLSLDNPAGPANYKVARDADVTVVLYNQRVVEANHAFKKGGLTEKDVPAIMKDVAALVK
jgi:hypothetical protein